MATIILYVAKDMCIYGYSALVMCIFFKYNLGLLSAQFSSCCAYTRLFIHMYVCRFPFSLSVFSFVYLPSCCCYSHLTVFRFFSCQQLRPRSMAASDNRLWNRVIYAARIAASRVSLSLALSLSLSLALWLTYTICMLFVLSFDSIHYELLSGISLLQHRHSLCSWTLLFLFLFYFSFLFIFKKFTIRSSQLLYDLPWRRTKLLQFRAQIETNYRTHISNWITEWERTKVKTSIDN